jgi:ribosomal-protein-alanine N-acetyltransferase
LAIENLAYDFPWSQEKITNSTDNTNALANVVLVDDQVVGYLLALTCVDFVDILNICIHPKHQHQGLGRQLFNHFKHAINNTATKSIFLEVKRSNDVAIAFYQSLGFESIDTRKKYYSNGEGAKILRFIL